MLGRYKPRRFLCVDRALFEELRAWVLLCLDLLAFVGCCVDACNGSVGNLFIVFIFGSGFLWSLLVFGNLGFLLGGYCWIDSQC